MFVCPPPNSGCNYLSASFNAAIQQFHSDNWFTNDYADWNSNSATQWSGSNPANADQMMLTDSWTAYTSSWSSFNASYPPSAQWSQSGNTVQWSSGWVSTTNYVSHQMAGLEFSTSGHFTGYTERAQGDARFGSEFDTVGANWNS